MDGIGWSDLAAYVADYRDYGNILSFEPLVAR